MAKKVKSTKKGGKRILSLIFHVIVLIVMVNIYDAARALFRKDLPPPPKLEKPVTSVKTSDGTFEYLMAEKKKREDDKVTNKGTIEKTPEKAPEKQK